MTTSDVISSPGLVESLQRYRRSSGAIVLGFTVLGILMAALAPSDYQASATITPADQRSASVSGVSGQSTVQEFARDVAAEARFVASDSVLRPVAEARGVSLDTLRRSVSVSISGDNDYVIVIGKDPDRETAADIVNDVVTTYAQVKTESNRQRADDALARLRDQADNLNDRIDALGRELASSPNNQAAQTKLSVSGDQLAKIQQRISDIEVNSAVYSDDVGISDKAVVPADAGLKPYAINALAGFAIGLLVATIVAWLRAASQPRVETRSGPTAVIDAPLVGSVPRMVGTELRSARVVASMPAPAFQRIASAVQLKHPSGVVLVAGIARASGGSTTSANVAAALARSGRSVALIDADPTEGGLARMLGVRGDSQPGLADRIEARTADAELSSLPLDDRHELAVMVAGGDPASFESTIRSTDTAAIFEHLRSKYDYVVVDCPPLTESSVLTSLIPYCDDVVAVVRHRTKLTAVEAANEVLSLVPYGQVSYVYSFDPETASTVTD